MIPLGLPAWPSAHLGPRASDLVDGRLPPGQEVQARAHLAGCADCAAQVQAERALRAALRGLAVPGAPPRLVAGLLALPAGSARHPHPGTQPPARPARPAPRRRFGAAVVGTMALASAGALGIGAATGPEPPSRPRPAAVVGGSPGAVRPPGAPPAGAQLVGLRTAGVAPVPPAAPSLVVAPASAGAR